MEAKRSASISSEGHSVPLGTSDMLSATTDYPSGKGLVKATVDGRAIDAVIDTGSDFSFITCDFCYLHNLEFSPPSSRKSVHLADKTSLEILGTYDGKLGVWVGIQSQTQCGEQAPRAPYCWYGLTSAALQNYHRPWWITATARVLCPLRPIGPLYPS